MIGYLFIFYVSFFTDSFFLLLLLLPALFIYPLVFLLRRDFYYLIKRPRIVISERYIEIPTKDTPMKPIIKIGLNRLMYLKLITYDYWNDGIFTLDYGEYSKEEMKVIDRLSEMDMDKLHRISIMYVSNNEMGSHSLEIKDEFFRSRKDFLEFVEIFFSKHFKNFPKKKYRKTKQMKEMIRPFKKLEGPQEIVRPEEESIYYDRFLNRIFTQKVGYSAMAPLIVAFPIMMLAFLFSIKPLLTIGMMIALIPLGIYLIVITTSIVIAFKFCGPLNFHFSTTMGISEYGLFFFKRKGEKGKTMDYIVPWKLVKRIKYSSNLRSFAIYQDALLLDVGKGVAPWIGVRCFFFTNKDALEEMEEFISEHRIEYNKI